MLAGTVVALYQGLILIAESDRKKGNMTLGYMKVPEKYDPKNAHEFRTFDRAMTKLLTVPAAEARDLAILNDAADRLNLEAADVLGYQAADE